MKSEAQKKTFGLQNSQTKTNTFFFLPCPFTPSTTTSRESDSHHGNQTRSSQPHPAFLKPNLRKGNVIASAFHPITYSTSLRRVYTLPARPQSASSGRRRERAKTSKGVAIALSALQRIVYEAREPLRHTPIRSSVFLFARTCKTVTEHSAGPEDKQETRARQTVEASHLYNLSIGSLHLVRR